MLSSSRMYYTQKIKKKTKKKIIKIKNRKTFA